MLRLASDEDVHGAIVRGLLRREPALDLVRIQDTELSGAHDRDVLKWAAAEGRVLITSDESTLVGFAWERVEAGEPMPGVLVVRDDASIGPAIEDTLIVAVCYSPEEMDQRILYIPL